MPRNIILHGISVKKNAFDLHKRMIFNMTFSAVASGRGWFYRGFAGHLGGGKYV